MSNTLISTLRNLRLFYFLDFLLKFIQSKSMNSSKAINSPDYILPQDIIIDIVSRLPAKSIGRFRCVSKPWKSLLSQPQFIKTHLNRTKQLFGEDEASLLFVSDDPGSLYSSHLKYAHHLFDEITISATKLCFDDHHFSSTQVCEMGSCDGLVLVMDKECNFVLINPTTKEIKELPALPYDLDLRLCDTQYGLGYDSVNDDYKVVSISYNCKCHGNDHGFCEMFVNAYSVRNGTWEKLEGSPYDHGVGYRYSSGIFIHGYIHWLGVRLSDTSFVIMAFDLGQGNKFKEVSPPSGVLGDQNFVFNHLVELGGVLSWYPSSSWFPCSNAVDIYMMKEYDDIDSWTNFSIIHPEPIRVRPLCLLGKKQLVLLKNEGFSSQKLEMYNLERGTSKDIAVLGIPSEFSVGGGFIESLVSPHCSIEAVREC